MFYNQKGFLPSLFKFLSISIPSIFFIYSTITVFPYYLKSLEHQPVETVFTKTLYLIFGLLIYLLIPLFIGILLAGIFPSISVTPKGIRYLFLGGLMKGNILWKEISNVHYLRNGFVIITINRAGLPIINGLYLNTMYGRAMGYYDPILILSPKLENFKNILDAITTNTET